LVVPKLAFGGLATFDWDGTPGIGISEFALMWSRSYTYRPTLVG